jgi:hypothetical protein
MASTDDIGSRGESNFEVLVTKIKRRDRQPLFRTHFLGDKFGALDYLVELVGFRGGSAHCFVQVKTTTRGYTSLAPQRLRVDVTQKDIDRMIAFPAPTYVVGVDEPREQA